MKSLKLKKKSLKKIKCWQRTGGFTFWAGEKVPVWLTYLALFSPINFFKLFFEIFFP